MKKRIDLHVHSTASDGTFAPAELVTLARKQGLSAFALTDHDSTEGLEEALNASKDSDIEVIPGVELSTEYNGTEIHVVGLFIDWQYQPFAEHLRNFRDCRDNRNIKMLERLQEEGFHIKEQDLHDKFGDCVMTRAHIARYLVDTRQVPELSIVFNEYIGNGCKCYVDRPKVSPVEAVKLIHQAGGIAILAHPCLYKLEETELLSMLEAMCAVGLDGIEAIYSCNKSNDEAYYSSLAEKYHLAISGGSDFHGSNKPDIQLGSGKGNLEIPYELLEKLRKKYGNYKTNAGILYR